MAFLTKGLRIDFKDERGEGFEESFQYDGGIVDFVNYLHGQGTRYALSLLMGVVLMIFSALCFSQGDNYAG